MVDKRLPTTHGDDKIASFPSPIVSEAVKLRLLVVEDDQASLPIVERCARQLGFDVLHRHGGRDVVDQIGDLRPHVAIVDQQLSEANGIDVLQKARLRDPDCQVILMTANASVDAVLRAFKAGALDCLRKPIDVDRLREMLIAIKSDLALRERLLQLDAEIASHVEFQGMIGRSAATHELFQSIRRLAPHGHAVLITGETGTGKELVARAIHDVGPRRAKRFLIVDCSTLDEAFVERELFGDVLADAGEAANAPARLVHAHKGTLLLDRVDDLAAAIQSRLLRVVAHGEIQRPGSLETRLIDVRVIATTTRDLRADVAANRFRSDLFQRLSTIHLHVPALRERREDIPYLAAAFVQAASRRLGRPVPGIAAGAERRLQDAHWTGNVRELRNVIEQACVMGDGTTLSERDIVSAMTAAGAALPDSSAGKGSVARAGRAVPDLLTTAQHNQIARVLREEGGNKAAAAKRLGVSRRSLYRWLVRLDIRI